MNEVKFFLEEPAYLVLMPDESLTISPGEYFADSFEKTTNYWDNWCASLNVRPKFRPPQKPHGSISCSRLSQLPNDYQDEVMHASVVLKLCSWEETGGLISSMTTSIATSPEPRSGALRDQRYCFLRDSCYIVRTMANLNVTSMMDGFRKYLHNIKVNHPEAEQSVYGIGTENRLVDKTVHPPPPLKMHNELLGLTFCYFLFLFRSIALLVIEVYRLWALVRPSIVVAPLMRLRKSFWPLRRCFSTRDVRQWRMQIS